MSNVEQMLFDEKVLELLKDKKKSRRKNRRKKSKEKIIENCMKLTSGSKSFFEDYFECIMFKGKLPKEKIEKIKKKKKNQKKKKDDEEEKKTNDPFLDMKFEELL